MPPEPDGIVSRMKCPVLAWQSRETWDIFCDLFVLDTTMPIHLLVPLVNSCCTMFVGIGARVHPTLRQFHGVVGSVIQMHLDAYKAQFLPPFVRGVDTS